MPWLYADAKPYATQQPYALGKAEVPDLDGAIKELSAHFHLEVVSRSDLSAGIVIYGVRRKTRRV